MTNWASLHASSVLLAIFLSGASTIACGGGAIVPPVNNGSGDTTYAQQAATGIQELQLWYSNSSGLYASPSGWWNAANSITMLGDYEMVTGDRNYVSVLANTFTAAQQSHANFTNEYFDDSGWWALAWIEAYDVTGNAQYLAMAETVFNYIASNGWDTSVCGGGVWWSTAKTYKNAIPNELFLTIAAKLANRTTGPTSAGYLNWAKTEWAWFKASGMINGQNLVNDGLTSTNPAACVNNNKTTWTYNQGVILGGLVELYQADQDPTLLPQAEAIADAAKTKLVTANGILVEPQQAITGGDVPQFKGVFLRNLMELYAALPATSTEAAKYKAFADANANSIWANDRTVATQFGAYWQGPVDSTDAARQTSALDALVAAAAMQ